MSILTKSCRSKRSVFPFVFYVSMHHTNIFSAVYIQYTFSKPIQIAPCEHTSKLHLDLVVLVAGRLKVAMIFLGSILNVSHTSETAKNKASALLLTLWVMRSKCVTGLIIIDKCKSKPVMQMKKVCKLHEGSGKGLVQTQ